MGKLGVERGGGRERAKIEAARGFTRRVTLMKIAKDEVARAWRRRWRWRRWRRREEMVGEAVGIHEGGIRISETRLA